MGRGVVDLNATLLQLYAVFGPMLKSALELVDDSQGGMLRPLIFIESAYSRLTVLTILVTKVSLPSGRAVYQVRFI